MSVENFLKIKKIKYQVIEADYDDAIYIFLKDKERFKNREFLNNGRTYIFALDDKKIIGYACLADNEKNNMKYIHGSLTLSNIEVLEEYRNIGVATNIINLAMDSIKEKNKILRRTKPDFLGKIYIFEKIKDIAKEKGVNFIPHNLTFIYDKLSKKEIFQSLQNKDKENEVIKIAEEMLSHKILKEWNLESIDDVNMDFYDAFEEIIQNKEKKEYKLKKQKI